MHRSYPLFSYLELGSSFSFDTAVHLLVPFMDSLHGFFSDYPWLALLTICAAFQLLAQTHHCPLSDSLFLSVSIFFVLLLLRHSTLRMLNVFSMAILACSSSYEYFLLFAQLFFHFALMCVSDLPSSKQSLSHVYFAPVQ